MPNIFRLPFLYLCVWSFHAILYPNQAFSLQVQTIDSSLVSKSWNWQTVLPYSQAIQLTNQDSNSSIFKMHFNGNIDYTTAELIQKISLMEPLYPNEPIVRKIWRYLVDRKYNFIPLTDKPWAHTPLIFLNSIGFGYCRNFSLISQCLYRYLGYNSRAWGLLNHAVPEVQIDSRWEIYDPTYNAYYFNTDGNIASIQDLHEHPSLITNPIFPFTGNPFNAYAQSVADNYASFEELNENGMDITEDLNFELPPLGAIVFPGVFSKILPATYEVIYVPSHANVKIIIPRGQQGFVDAPLVLHEIIGSGEILINNEIFTIPSPELNAKINSRDQFIHRVKILSSSTDIEITYLINPKLFQIEKNNIISAHGSNINKLTASVVDLAPGERITVGKLSVNIPQSNGNDIQWSLDGIRWRNSGEELVIPTGRNMQVWGVPPEGLSRIIRYKNIAGGLQPNDQGVLVDNDASIEITSGPNVPRKGLLKVNVLPVNDSLPNEWSVMADLWNSSGVAILSDVGTHDIKFKKVSNWHIPVSKEVSVTENNLTTMTAVYTRNTAPIFVTSSDTLVDEDRIYEYTIRAIDNDSALFHDQISYEWTVLPSWLSIDSSKNSISGTPRINNLNDTVVVVQARDGNGGNAIQEYHLHVQHINHKPQISNPGQLQAAEDIQFNYHIIASDIDTLVGDILYYSAVDKPQWLKIDTLKGDLSGIPYGSDVGDTSFTVMASDNHGAVVSQRVMLKIGHTNHSPIINIFPLRIAQEDTLYRSTIYATDQDTSLFMDRVKYRFLVKPGWLTIDSLKGVITGVPGINSLNDTTAVLQAYDQEGGADSLYYSIHIQHTNHIPSISTSDLLTASEDSTFAYAVSATDIDTLVGDMLHYRLSAKPSWLLIDSVRGRVSGVPRGINVGDTTFTVLVDDGHSGIASRLFSLKVLHTNHSPVIGSMPGTSAVEDLLYRLSIHASDQDSLLFGDRVRYRFITRPAWLAIDSVTGIISGTPNITHLADTSAAVQAYDNAGGADTLRFSIPIRHVNHPPQLAGIALQIADEDARFSFRAVGSDIDTLTGDLLRYRMSPVISWLRIDTITGSVSGIPGEFNVGDTTTTLIVTDKAGVSASTPLAIRVRHVNHDPVFNTNDLPNAVEDTLYIVKIDAEDRDSLLFGDRLTYSLKGPVWLSIDPLTGLISGTPIGINARDTVVGVGVSDGNGGAIYQTMTLHVKHVNHTPVILSQPLIAAREDSTYRYKVITADQDSVLGDKVRVLSTIIPSWMKFDSSKAEYVGIPGPSQVGDTTISFSVIDGSGAQTVQKFVISVSHTNHAPQIITQSVPDAIEDSSYASSISAIDSDGTAFGDKLVYRVSGNSWLTIDSVSGALKGKPGLLNVQKNGFTITVLDGQGGVTTQAYTLTVRHTNHPPVFTSVPDTLVFEDSLYAYHPVAIDTDTKLFNDVVTDTLISAPAFLSASGVLGAISGIPRNDYFNWNRANIRLGVSGAYADTIVTIRARDDKGASALQRFVLRVVHRNHPPVILSKPDTAAVEDAAYHYKISVTDIDKNAFNDSTNFTFISKPAWLSYNAVDSSITGVASGVNVRDSIVVFEISDGNGGRARQSFNLHVTPVNHPPVISSIPRPAAFEDSLYVYMIQTQDPDRQFKRDSVTLRLVSGPSWLSLNRETMTLSGKPEWMDIGDSLVTIEAKDLAGGTAYQNWRLAVNGVRYVPLPQGLLFPKRSDTVTVQAVSSEIKFGWKSAKDRNLHDTLFYRVHCWKDHVDTLTSWMRDTTWTLNWTRTASTIHDFNWTVFVTDKYYTVQAKDTFTVIIKGLTTGVREWDSSIPADYIVYQNYPNPFNPSTTIRFGLPERSKVSVDIYNTLGQLVESVYHDMVLDPRYYEVVWNANGRANGMYLAVMHAESFSQPHRNFRSVKKLLLIK